MQIEQIIQIISILAFLSGAAMFFVKTGAFKNTIEREIITLQEKTKENKQEIKNLKNDFLEMKTNNAQVTSRLETLLIEVKTKLELIMQLSGLFNKDEKP